MRDFKCFDKFKTDRTREGNIVIANAFDENGNKVRYKTNVPVYNAGLGDLIKLYVDLSKKNKWFMSETDKWKTKRSMEIIEELLNQALVDWNG